MTFVLIASKRDAIVAVSHESEHGENGCLASTKRLFNPLPPSDAIRKQKKNILEDFLSSVLSQFKKYHPSGNLTFNNLGIFQSLTFRILMKKKILPISLKVNFTPNILSCCGFTHSLSKPELFWRQLDLLKPLNSTLLIDAKNNKT